MTISERLTHDYGRFTLAPDGINLGNKLITNKRGPEIWDEISFDTNRDLAILTHSEKPCYH